MYVCLCHGVTDSEIREAADAGCSEMPELMMRTGCGSSCGSCVDTATGLLEALQPVEVEGEVDPAGEARPAIAAAA